MKPKYTIRDFERQFPTEDSCLEWLMDYLYPSGVHCHVCDRVTAHYRVKSRKSYSCSVCGHHVHPMAGTIFHKSTTPLRLWFYAMFLMSNSRTGVAAKHLERELGVTYKTAWRMFKQIRSMLDEGTCPLSGVVEVDETYIYGKCRRFKHGVSIIKDKTVVAGAVERDGRILTEIVPNTYKSTLSAFVLANVDNSSTLYTDESQAYSGMRQYGYTHKTVTHWDHEYVRGDVHTNTIEGFWGNFKTGLRGCYKHCGVHYLQSYLNEYAFRYNHRHSSTSMFNLFMAQTRQLDWWTPYTERRPKS